MDCCSGKQGTVPDGVSGMVGRQGEGFFGASGREKDMAEDIGHG